MSTARTYAAFVAVCAAALAFVFLLVPNPAHAAVVTDGHPTTYAIGSGSVLSGRYPHTCTGGPAVTADRAWAEHVVGCDTDVDDATVARLVALRDLGAEGLSAGVPARTIVGHFAAVLGDRSEAVTLFTATAVYAYGG